MELKDALTYALPALATLLAFLAPAPLVLLPYAILTMILIVMRCDGRVPLALGGAVLALAGTALVFNEKVADQVSILGYWLSATGTIVLLASLLLAPKKRG